MVFNIRCRGKIHKFNKNYITATESVHLKKPHLKNEDILEAQYRFLRMVKR